MQCDLYGSLTSNALDAVNKAVTEGRLGFKSKSPVSFKLSLKKAQIKIVGDDSDILRFVPDSIRNTGDFLPRNLQVNRHSTSSSLTIYEFKPEEGNSYLEGEMSTDSLNKPMLNIRDTRSDLSKEPPEVLVQVRCRREDLDIKNIRLTSDDDAVDWENASENKKLCVKQYLREELLELSLEMGDLDDGYSTFVFAESTAFEEHYV